MLIHNIPYLYIYICECSFILSAAYLLMLLGAYRRGAQWLAAISGASPPSGQCPLAPPRRYACLVWQDFLHLEYLSYFCGFYSILAYN